MKVALYTDTYDEINGVGNTYRKLIEYCGRTGRMFDVHTYTDAEPGVEDRGSVRVFRYRPRLPLAIYSDLVFDLALSHPRAVEEAMKARYDIVHVATPGSMGLTGLSAARKLGVPLVSTYHTAVPEFAGRRVPGILRRPTEALLWRLISWFYNHCEVVLSPSKFTRDSLKGRFKCESGIFTRGVDTDRFHPGYREAPKKTTVTYVGRVSVEKNLPLLVRAFTGMAGVALKVVGDGPYLEKMKKECPTAEYTGMITGDALSRAYASADVFAFPSETDTFGNVVLEAMSSGIPAVVTDKMGPKEIVIDGETGFVASTHEEFVDKLRLLVTDGPLRKEMGRKAREYALTRSWDRVFEDLFEQYARYAGGGRA